MSDQRDWDKEPRGDDYLPNSPIPFSEQQSEYVRTLATAVRRSFAALIEVERNELAPAAAIRRLQASLGVLELAFVEEYASEDDASVAKGLGNFVPPTVLDSMVTLLDTIIDVVRDEGHSFRIAAALDTQVEEALTTVEHFSKTFRDVEPPYREWIRKQATRVRESLTVNQLLDRARRSAIEANEAEADARRAATHVKEVAGQEATGELAEHFEMLAREERGPAFWFRGLAFTLGVAVAALASVLLTTATESTTGELVRKLAITVPLAALGAYAAKEASGHRTAYRWARRVEVQLRTMRAFVQPLPSDLQHIVLAMIAHEVFSSRAEAPRGDENRDMREALERLVDRLVNKSTDER